MQVAGPGPNLGWIRKQRNWRFNRVVPYDPLVGWKPTKIHYMIRSNPIQQNIFFTENPYEGSYVGPYEGSNAGLNGMPKDYLKKQTIIL